MTLPLRQQQLYDALAGKGDVSFSDLCEAIEANLENIAYPQNWLGPYITQLNRRIRERGLKVVPGDLKGTYRLTVI